MKEYRVLKSVSNSKCANITQLENQTLLLKKLL
jgi:hypothetical protein